MAASTPTSSSPPTGTSVAGAAPGFAVALAMDMTEGIIARFRTMAIFRPSVLTGHVLGDLIQTMLTLAVVIGVALLVGFRPNANAVELVAAVGVLAMIAFAVIWLSVACGLVAKTPEAASNLPVPLVLLPVLGSGFVPTDSMPTAVRWFAEYQPFTRSSRPCAGCCLAPRSATAPSSPRPGASPSPWPATSGPRSSTTAIRQADPATRSDVRA